MGYIIALLVIWVAWILIQKASAGNRESHAALVRPARAVPPVVSTTMVVTLTYDALAEAAEDEAELASEDQWAHVAMQPVSSNATVDLIYRDAEGTKTRRRVTVREFDYAAPRGYLDVFCHLRNARRTFILDRVIEAVDPETGEVLASFHSWLREKYDASPEKALDDLYTAQRDALRVLLYVARADGRFMAAERAIARQVARDLSDDARLTDGQIDGILHNVDPPSKAVFQKCVGDLAASGDTQRCEPPRVFRRLG
ncbi:MAG TPA: hypothetical protein VE869_13135 [Gemmatimonas sp.]|nr:hypothetical protein [Gemmatimonas sp.]